ncbi:MAG: hypothetical protein R3A79_18665 [Nannocystaceae bacterium]
MPLSEAKKRYYATIYILKMVDLDPREGGVEIPVLVPPELAPIEDLLESMAIEGLLAIERKRQRYVLTDRGVESIGLLIDEIEAIIDEFDDEETDAVIAELRARNLDVLRIRFLWGWYDGEFDDVVLYQERRGFPKIETDWAAFILSDAFYDDLLRDL